MTDQLRHPYLFLLSRPSLPARREAARLLRELGLRVAAQYGSVAIEAIGTPDRAEAALASGLFTHSTRNRVKRDHLEKLSSEQRRITEMWNARFTKAFRTLTRDLTHVGKHWNAKGMAEPLPYSAVDPRDFLLRVERYEKETGRRLLPRRIGGKQRKTTPRAMPPQEFVRYERRLAERYKSERLAYYAARLAQRLGPEYYAMIAALPAALLDWLRDLLAEELCWKMTGEMAVGIVFVESSRSGGPKFSASERDDICNEILGGHQWLVEEHPTGELSFVYDIQFAKIDVANGSGDPQEDYWRDPAMGQVTYDGTTYTAAWSSVAAYREAMRVANFAKHGLVIFVTPYANSWFAYAGSGRVTLAKKDDWGSWGRGTIDRIAAHETSHLFGSADEYTGSGTPCSTCGSTHGCDHIPNGNCGSCAHPQQSCVMESMVWNLCAYTRGQIGWAPLFVELRTADEQWAGTDDDVWLDIGDRTFVLDTPDHDDRERGNIEGYAIWAPEVARADIKRVLIRKSPDGFAGGWKLGRVRLWHEGEVVCDGSPNQWLEDNRRWWVGCVTNSDIVTALRVRVTTADVGSAGTDDTVTLTLAGYSWDLDNPDHDDFERGNTDSFTLDPQTGLYRSAIHSIRIHKSPDGWFGGWKLKGVELIVNGATIYNNQSINQWLEDDTRTWSAVF
jgi:hypothetical protein